MRDVTSLLSDPAQGLVREIAGVGEPVAHEVDGEASTAPSHERAERAVGSTGIRPSLPP